MPLLPSDAEGDRRSIRDDADVTAPTLTHRARRTPELTSPGLADLRRRRGGDRGRQCRGPLARPGSAVILLAHAALAGAGLCGSMSREGYPYDDAHAASFMKTFKHEEALLMPDQSMDDLLARIPQYLERTYSHLRLHSALGYMPPSEFETQHQCAVVVNS